MKTGILVYFYTAHNSRLNTVGLVSSIDKAKRYLEKKAIKPMTPGNSWKDKKYKTIYWNYAILKYL